MTEQILYDIDLMDHSLWIYQERDTTRDHRPLMVIRAPDAVGFGNGLVDV